MRSRWALRDARYRYARVAAHDGPYEFSDSGRRRRVGPHEGVALAAACELLGLLLEPVGWSRHRSGADGDPVRRPHRASRPRDLRYRRAGRREDLRPGGASRSFSAFRPTIEAPAPWLT